MPSRSTVKLLWPGPPSRTPLTQQCPSGMWNRSESQPPSMPNAPGPDRAVLYWPNLFHSCTGPELRCCWVHVPFPNTPSSSEQLRNSKSRMIPSGGLLGKTEERQIQPVQGLMACIFLVYYHMELRKPKSHLLIFVCCETKGHGLTFLLWAAFEVRVSPVLCRAPRRRSHLIWARRWLVLFGFSGYHLCFTRPVAIWLIC